ncbi:histidine kinase N-terminal domain-containing protein, partial [Streptosporangium sp. NPDC048865]
MPTLSDLAVRHTALDDADLEWMHSLVSDWQLLADLSFADLILWIPLKEGSGWIAIAQMRPTTGPTVYHDDIVGMTAAKGERPLLETAWNER